MNIPIYNAMLKSYKSQYTLQYSNQADANIQCKLYLQSTKIKKEHRSTPSFYSKSVITDYFFNLNFTNKPLWSVGHIPRGLIYLSFEDSSILTLFTIHADGPKMIASFSSSFGSG